MGCARRASRSPAPSSATPATPTSAARSPTSTSSRPSATRPGTRTTFRSSRRSRRSGSRELPARNPDLEALQDLRVLAHLALGRVQEALAARVEDAQIEIGKGLVQIPVLDLRVLDLEVAGGVRVRVAEMVVEDEVLVVGAHEQALERATRLVFDHRAVEAHDRLQAVRNLDPIGGRPAVQ